MIKYKTSRDLEDMEAAGMVLRKAVEELLPQVKAGMTTEEVDRLAEDLIRRGGGEPGFKRVDGYRWATCLPINEQVVHTPPSKRKLKDGDVLTIDIGAYYLGWNTDCATTFVIGGRETPRVKHFLDTGKKALEEALSQVKEGNRLGHISAAIEARVRQAGYHICRSLTGHGIGHELHEDPFIPGYVEKPVDKTAKLKSGMALAVEVIYAMGTEEIASEGKEDDWSLISADRSLTACFEHTVIIKDGQTKVIT